MKNKINVIVICCFLAATVINIMTAVTYYKSSGHYDKAVGSYTKAVENLTDVKRKYESSKNWYDNLCSEQE